MGTENIRVYLRVRPFGEREAAGTSVLQTILNETSGEDTGAQETTVVVGNARTGTEVFTFDAVGEYDISQEKIFSQVAKPVCDNCLLGYNGTILA